MDAGPQVKTATPLASFVFASHIRSIYLKKIFKKNAIERTTLRSTVSQMVHRILKETRLLKYQSKKFCPVLIALEGSASRGNRAWDLRKKNRKKYWNRGDNKP